MNTDERRYSILNLCVSAFICGLFPARQRAAHGAGTLALAGPVFAAGASSQQLSNQDKQFVNKAAQAGKAEVKFGKLASNKAKSVCVQDFGHYMVVDH